MTKRESMQGSLNKWVTFVMVLVVLVALTLRLVYGCNKSFFIDDFCSLHHAGAANLAAYFDGIRQDITPPLYYGLLRVANAVFGDGELACRIPGLLASMATLLLIGALARRRIGTGTALLAMAILGVSSFELEMSALVRSFALMALAVTGLLGSISRILNGEGRGWPLAFWVVVGLHAHYFFLHYLLLFGIVTFILLAIRPEVRGRVYRAIGWTLAGCAAALPWFLWGFLHQVKHGPDPGGAASSLRIFAESLVHLQYIHLSIAGSGPALVFALGGILALGLGAMTVLGIVVGEKERPFDPTLVYTAVAAVGVPLFAATLAWVHPRCGYSWSYIAGSGPPLALLIAASWEVPQWMTRTRRVALAFVLASSAVLAGLVALSPGNEDYRGAVASVLASAGPEDGVIPVEWTPHQFPQGQPWAYYAPRLQNASTPSLRLLTTREWDLANPGELIRCQRVYVVNRNVPTDLPLFVRLRQRYPKEAVQHFGYSLTVHRFSRQ